MNQIMDNWKGFEPIKLNQKRSASQDSTYANLVWNAENAGLRSDAKFSTYLKGIKKSLKASKALLKKTKKSFDGLDFNLYKGDVIKIFDNEVLNFYKESESEIEGKKQLTYGRRRESNGEYKITFTNHAKKTVRQRNFENMQKKVDQIVYEDFNSHRIVKYLTNAHVDPALLMQPKFSCSDAKYASVWKKPNIKTITRKELNKRAEDIKEASLHNDSIFSPGRDCSFTSYRPQPEEDFASQERSYFRMNLSKLLQAVDGESPTKSTKEINKHKLELTAAERKQMMRIAKGQALEGPPEEKEQENHIQRDFKPISPSKFKQRTKLTGSMDQLKISSIVENLLKKNKSDMTIANSLPSSPKMAFFTTVKEMKTIPPQKFTIQTAYESYADMDPNSETFTPIFLKKQAVMKMEAESSIPANSKRSLHSDIKMESDEVVVDDYKAFKRAMSQKEINENEDLGSATDRSKHKRNSQSEFKQREKYSIKIDSFVSQNEVKKTIENSKRKFFEDRLENFKRTNGKNFYSSRPVSSYGNSPTCSVNSDVIKEFKRLTSACKTNIKSTARMKKTIKKTFGDIKKTFGQMNNRLMIDRDVEFEAQLKKDIKHDLANFNPNVPGLLRGKTGKVEISKRDRFY